jgi:hypothetical protein
MGDRNDVKLAIGYGIGAGMALAGLAIAVGAFLLSSIGIDAGAYLLGAVFAFGGIAIAVVNAIKLDRSAVPDAGGSE